MINNETTTREIVESMIKKWDSEINITVEQADFHESFELRIKSLLDRRASLDSETFSCLNNFWASLSSFF